MVRVDGVRLEALGEEEGGVLKFGDGLPFVSRPEEGDPYEEGKDDGEFWPQERHVLRRFLAMGGRLVETRRD